MDIGGSPTRFAMDIPAGTQSVRLVCAGILPRPFLACTELCVVAGEK